MEWNSGKQPLQICQRGDRRGQSVSSSLLVWHANMWLSASRNCTAAETKKREASSAEITREDARPSVCLYTQGNLGVVETLNKSLKETHHLFLLSVRRCDSVPQTEHTHKQTHYAVSFTAKQCGKASEIRGPSFEGSSKNKTDVYGIFLRGGGQIQFNCRSKTTVSLS